jgi:glycosyltransferase involved in cell wall biosynthesis
VRISVVIPAFNEERLLGETLCQISRALTVFERRQWETELIVCDNHSTDRTADVACNGGARVVFEPVNQIARARNCGAAAATGDWLIFVDADSHPGIDLMEDVAVQIESGRCLAGGAVVRLDGQQRSANWVAHLWNGTSRVLGWVAGSFVFCETRAFRAIGGFSSEWFACEEIDLSIRLNRLARTERKKIVILHRHPILTSARKIHLYSLREHLWFLIKVLVTGGRVLSNRKACHIWYDGRR